ncbi:MAG: Gldg family protein [Oligoflexus sp.]|nr:Gldg family protein [Oligoflexus sp.]
MKGLVRRMSLLFFLVGSAFIFAAERYGLVPNLSLLIGFILYAVVFLLDALSLRGSEGQQRIYLKVAMAWKLSWLIGTLLFILSQRFLATQTLVSVLLQAASAALIILGAFVAFGVELSALRSESFDAQDAVSRRWRSSLSLGLIFIGLLGINFAANKKDRSYDFSYLKTSRAGDASRLIVERLGKPVRVGVFFSKQSEVLPLVREYFQSFPAGQLSFEYYDKDFNPVQSEEFRVARNGQIVVMEGEKRQRFEIGDKLEEAKRNLPTLDASFQKALLQLTSEPTIIYFTSTHGEMLWESGAPLRTMAAFEAMLRSQNFRARRLTALFQNVPPEAKVLGIVGPVTGFTSPEIDALSRFLARGGRLLIALDIDKGERAEGASDLGDEMPKFLDQIGLHYVATPVAHDERFVTNARDKSDRYFVYSNKFADHPAVSTLKTNSDRLSTMSFRTGSWDVTAHAKDWVFTPLVSAMTGSFRDANGNFEADASEARENYPLIVAGESLSKAKIVVFADATALSDTLMKNTGNQLAALDIMRWLSDRSGQQAGAVETEEDVLIRHENSRDLLVFLGSIYLIPLLVLGFGYFVNRRKGRRA